MFIHPISQATITIHAPLDEQWQDLMTNSAGKFMLDIQLTHEEQQRAVEKIQELMAKGINSGEAIQIVARELRELYEKSAKILKNKIFCDLYNIFKYCLLHKKQNI
ncbi:Uncharacterized protein conserved in bacteria [Rodentibacter pneumotropicus]|uniref:UPF0181 protein NCTC8284_02367 n=1 Tax=Rodentibacter pneumotropicus TaxID=758 RepID=A0A448MPW0_9PAST|nr:Uncharacterized protein conserved in bacteria [Rodentibacter pneumotropicus]